MLEPFEMFDLTLLLYVLEFTFSYHHIKFQLHTAKESKELYLVVIFYLW